MKILKLDTRKRAVRLVPESTLDLINIYRMLSEGDVVYARTSREVKKQRADGSVDSERVRVTIGVTLEKKSLDGLTRRLKLLGKISYASMDIDIVGKHHSLNVSVGTEITIESRRGFDRLLSFAKHFVGRRENRVLCIVMDDERYAIVMLSDSGMEIVDEGGFARPSKDMPEEHVDSLERKYSEIVQTVKRKLEVEKASVVLLGTSMTLEKFVSYLRKRDETLLRSLSKVANVSEGSVAGLQEALRNKVLSELGIKVKPVLDAEIVEGFVEKMSSDFRSVALGIEEVYRASELGALSSAIVTEDFLWDRLDDERLLKILELVDAGKLNIHIILSGTESGDKVLKLGGIVGVLRYPLELSRS